MRTQANKTSKTGSLAVANRFSKQESNLNPTNAAIIQAVFSQTDPQRQEMTFKGVKAGYDATTNTVDLHIEAGANREKNLIPNFWVVLRDVRKALIEGEKRGIPGEVKMRPGGAKVLKMTMEMLGEAVGQGQGLQDARAAKTNRQDSGLAANAGLDPEQTEDVLGPAIMKEHISYLNSMVEVPGMTMYAIGRGTSGGTVDMLHGDDAARERDLYHEALSILTPFMGLHVTINLQILNRVIAMIGDKIPLFEKGMLLLGTFGGKKG